MDTNGRVLHRAVRGATLNELRDSGIQITDSQVLLLATYGLVHQSADRIQTAFPVVGPATIEPVRTRLRQLAKMTAPSLASDARSIADGLAQRGYPEHGYAVVFGYALDGLLWNDLGQQGAVPNTTLDLDHPFWRGAFWAIYPERVDVPGTNETACRQGALVSVWTDRTVNALKSMASRAVVSGTLTDEAWLARVPTIRMASGDPIHDAALRIATRTASAMLDTLEGHALLAAIPNATRQEATLIITHEFIWDLTEELVMAGVVEKPAVLWLDEPTPEQLTPLLFMRVPTEG